MNVTSWNCQGSTSKGFSGLMKDMMKKNNSNFVILLETHISGVKTKSVIRKTGLKGSFVEEASGFFGGIWCLWDDNDWRMKVLRTTNQYVHMKVRWCHH